MGGGGSPTMGPPPGTVDPFSLNVLQQNTSQALSQMQNRYNQLGIAGAVPPGGMQHAANTGGSLPNTGIQSTPEQMDIGVASGLPGTPSGPSGIPSMVGGIQQMAAATLGQEETNALTQPQPASAVSNSGKGGAGSALGPAIGAIGKGI